MYKRIGSNWIQQGTDIDGESANDYSGHSVSLSSDGTVLAIGAHANSANGSWSGQVRVYAWNGTAWTQKGGDIDGASAWDYFGYSVSLSADGNTLASGAYFNDEGYVGVYSWNGSSWVQKGIDIVGEAANDDFGFSVSLSSDGNLVAIGANLNDGNGSDAGHARVYSWNSSASAWQQKGGDIDGETAGDLFGFSVKLSSDGTNIAIGSRNNDDNGADAGHVRVYAWNGSAWQQKGNDIDGESAGDQSGTSVSMSSDGNILAIGAYGNNGFAGHARVYSWNGSIWVQKGADIEGEAAVDISGWFIDLSSDGNIIAIGAPYNNDSAAHAGHVRVYSFGPLPIPLTTGGIVIVLFLIIGISIYTLKK